MAKKVQRDRPACSAPFMGHFHSGNFIRATLFGQFLLVQLFLNHILRSDPSASAECLSAHGRELPEVLENLIFADKLCALEEMAR